MRNKKGISLIVLIITIIVVIILASIVILTLTKTNPIESAKEATFKDDIRTIQNELLMYLSKEYENNPNTFDKKSVNLKGNNMVDILPSSKKYIQKVKVKNGELVYIGDDEKEINWIESINVKKSTIPKEWKAYIDDITDDGVPIPKGFTYLTGTKQTGTVIEDSNHNEFVWIPVDTYSDYQKNLDYPNNYGPTELNTVDCSLPGGLTDESLDVKKYKGFYIGRFETTIADENGKPTCKKGNNLWTSIDYANSKTNAEIMYMWSSGSSVQSGLLTGKAWDTTCNWISDYKIKVNGVEEKISLTDSRKYGNYSDSEAPANIGDRSTKIAGVNENCITKNIYDLAGNLWEWTNEKYISNWIVRGGFSGNGGNIFPVCYRLQHYLADSSRGFRIRLYIKTN